MKPFSPRTLLFCSSSSSSSRSTSPPFLQLSHFSASQNQPPTSNTVSPYRRHEEGCKNVRVSVWWDFENCGVPAGANVFKVADNIFDALRANGIKGSVQITAFGDMFQLSGSHQKALSATGITLTHIPRGGKNSADRSLLVDLMYWVSENPPPAHLFLISADRSFSSILHRLRMKNYNILLASVDEAPSVLSCAASIMWHWQDLVSGQNFAGKHFNRPPDGPYGSWYGHSKAPLEDPFPVTVQPACSHIESFESSSDGKLRSVPKTVFKQIREILNSHPEGISITDLRAELQKANVSLDKNLYGHKKFSRFLISMPHILNLEDVGNGQYMIRGITTKFDEPVGLNSNYENGDGDVTNASLYGPENFISESLDMKDEDQNFTAKEACVVDKSVANGVDGKKLLSTPNEKMEKPSPEKQLCLKVQGTSKPCQKAVDGKKLLSTPNEKVEKPSPEKQLCLKVQGTSKPCQKAVDLFDEQLPDSLLLQMDRPDHSSNKMGILQIISTWWFGGESRSAERSDEEKCIAYCSSQKSSHQSDAKCSSADTIGKADVENKCVKSTNLNIVGDHPGSSSSIDNISDGEKIAASRPKSYTDGPTIKLETFNKIVKWLQSRKSSNTPDTLNVQESERQKHINRHSGGNDLFAADSFWSNMEAFINTGRGSAVLSQSITREELARNLQKEGPGDLSSLSESDLLHLVDLLISEKKWVEEDSSQTPPFKPSTCLDRPNGSNGLSSLFTSKSSHPDSAKQLECNRERKRQNISRTGSVIEDCQTLVDEILEKHPEGYYIGYFRKRFQHRYGYSFDFRELGYDKLASLLEALPGVKVVSSHIFSSGYSSDDYSLDITVPNIEEENATNRVGDSGRDTSWISKKDDVWEELGPVANTNGSKLEPEFKTSAEVPTGRLASDYHKPSLSDDSDLEEDICTDVAKVGQVKKPSGSEDSSLLHILGSWDSQREGEKSKSWSENPERKVKLGKKYSLVENEKVIDEIVDFMKKSRMHDS